MPSGEVFTAPLETSADGYILFDLPTLYGGQPVRGTRPTFRDGEVVEATAQEGEEVLRAALRTDESIQRPSMNILFDEKIGGTVHLAVGQAYPDNGGTNTSAVHWEMILDLCKGGGARLDGEDFQVDGRFVRATVP